MMDIGIKLNILGDILNKKKEVLTCILNICENQETLYLQPPSETRTDFLRQIGTEKQKFIDEVIQCDDVFQKMFEEMKNEFGAQADNHMPKIKQLQDGIKEVMELDCKIRIQEDKNKMYVKSVHEFDLAKRASTQKQKNSPGVAGSSKNYLLDQYKKNARK